jgi:hypothetical protein
MLAGRERHKALLPQRGWRRALARAVQGSPSLLRHLALRIHQVSCQGVVEMGGDMFQRYAVRVTMTAITAELKEYAQGWCWRWRGGTR